MNKAILITDMPSCCDECFALDDNGDYPRCRITREIRGYNFRTRELKMNKCPLKPLPEKLEDNDSFYYQCGENIGCRFCMKYEDLPEHVIDGEPIGKVFDTCIQTDENGLWHLELPSGADIGIKFCPYCGRELIRERF